jgi:hypothetical protein
MSNTCRRILFLALTCLLCVAANAGAGPRDTSNASADGGAARLIVHRIPTMGKFVFVQLYVDNVVIGAIAYGGTYEGFLRPGRHVLSALALPRPKWWERPPTIVHMRSGQTYEFTAIGNGQGNLILWDNKDTRPPRIGVFHRAAYAAAW